MKNHLINDKFIYLYKMKLRAISNSMQYIYVIEANQI